MLIVSTEKGQAAVGFSKLERAVVETSKEPVTMLILIDTVRMVRCTHFPPRRIADLLVRMESHGYVIISK